MNKRFESYLVSQGFKVNQYSRLFPEKTLLFRGKCSKLLQVIKLGVVFPIPFSRATKDSNNLIFPSCDFEDLLYLYFIFLFSSIKGNSKKIVVRFLMIDAENWTTHWFKRKIIFLILKLMNFQKHKFYFCAETLEGADFISSQIGIEVSWLPTPVASKAQFRMTNSCCLYLPGNPRYDKGSHEISMYVQLLESVDSKIKIVDQSEKQSSEIEIKNRIILDLDLSEEEFKAQLISSQWLFAPHIQTVYRLRGSALLADAIENRKLLLARKDTSLGNFVEKYKLGCTFIGSKDFLEATLKLTAMMDLNEIENSFKLAEEAVRLSVDSIFKILMKGEGN